MLCPSCGADAGDTSRYCPSCGATLVRAAEEDDYIGSIVNKKYRIEEMIGEGGMGKVYRAKQLALDKAVVLKVLRRSLLSDERTVARFQREAKAASRLNHPNSISILDFGQTDEGALYIAMEFIAGRDLHQILSKEWPLPESRVVRVVSQVLSALAEAHSNSIIHRDLKPENIMVEQRRGEPDFVKVLDFGIAKMLDSNEDGPALTRAGFVCGTPEYMSPEQARGIQLDHRSDLYAVGVILYQLMTGLLPFDSDSAVGFATKHLTEEPLPPTRRRPDAKISPGMERLIMKALSKDPNDRPESADAFRAELLAVDKERRSMNVSHGSSRSSRGVSSPVLQPLPRKVTPIEQEPTNIRTVNSQPWEAEATLQATVKVIPDALPKPQPVLPRPEKAMRSMASSGTASVSISTDRAVPSGLEVTAPSSISTDEEVPRADRSLLVFKLATVVLVLLAVALAGFYFYQVRSGVRSQGDEVVHPNAPVPINGANQPPYEREVPVEKRDDAAAAALAKEGDEAHERGDLSFAANRYLAAFEKSPSPELSLKLGEVFYRSGKITDAKGWWARHLRDQSQSRARRYIQESLGEATAP